MSHLSKFPDVFHIDTNVVRLSPELEGMNVTERSRSVAKVLHCLRDNSIITGWRDELYPVVSSFYEPAVLLIERAAASFFGIKAYGVHINGFVRLPDSNEIELWVARRSSTKPTWPGRLDHLVAGGQPHGVSLMENVVKECQEEAGISPELARQAKPVGAVSYTSIVPSGLKRDVLFCFDLELPLDFTPVPNDGEVEEFFRLPLQQVADTIAEGEDNFKDNCNLVIIDFLIRHGALPCDMPGYLDLVRGVRLGDCS